MQDMLDDGDYCTVPTLEELIEACRPFIVRFSSDGSNWASWGSLESRGSTPTDAVARLWLALHNNHEKAA